ncbi:MAG: DUF4097 domain-containing protein [Melioribacteraceae bacterium]|nr:DUF4097 domain-containing protein [Melioribacteraceae bacterium]
MTKKISLVVVLAIAGGLLLLFADANAQSRRTIHDKSFDVQPGQKLRIKTDVGDIRVKTWSKNEVSVKINGNREAEDKIEFSFDQDSEGVSIRGEKEGNSWGWFNSIKLEYLVMVPEQFDAYLGTSGGDVTVEDLKGYLHAGTSGGDVSAINHFGEKVLKTSGGDIDVSKGEGNVEAGTSGGDIRVITENGKIDCSTSGGDIEIDYKGENMGIYAGTSGGDIEIYIPREFKADVSLGTSGGRVKCRAEGTRLSSEKKTRIRGEINGGGNQIKGSTSGGNVLVDNR